jgi:hypothetical protein
LQTSVLQHYTTHTVEELAPCLAAMQDVLRGAATAHLQAVRRKYMGVRYGSVASLPVDFAL